MSKLIQSLVEIYHYGISNHVPVGVNPQLESEAATVYQQATKRLLLQRQSLTQEYKVTVQKIDREIAIQVTAELATVDLLDTEQYKTIKAAIKGWQPAASSENAVKCAKVRQALLQQFPAAWKNQHLKVLTKDYRRTLRSNIESALISDHPSVYQDYCREKMVLVTGKGEPQLQRIKAKDLDHFVKHDAPTLLIKKDDDLYKMMEKYASISTARDTLRTAKPATEQYQDFQAAYPPVKSAIEKSRDSAGMIFLKAVATVFTLGIAAAMGIWDVRGQKVAEKIDRVLSAPTPTAAPVVTAR